MPIVSGTYIDPVDADLSRYGIDLVDAKLIRFGIEEITELSRICMLSE